MTQFVGLDVAQKQTSVCVVDDRGARAWEGSVRTTPTALAAAIREHGGDVARVGMETGPLAVWLYHGLRELGIAVDCIHARHVHAALSVQINKTDRNDAHGIAQLVRSGWYRPIMVRSLESHEVRLLLTARQKLVGMRTGLSNQIRGLLKTFGVVLAAGRKNKFDRLVQSDTPSAAGIRSVIVTLLETWRHLGKQIREIDKSLARIVRADPVCRLLMTAPGVGMLTAVAFKTAVEDPNRFRRIADVGPFLGLTPKKYQSGEVDRNTSISKHGNRLTRSMMFEAAGVLLRRSRQDCALKRWAAKLEQRVGVRKATVALARKLATILLSMWKSGNAFVPGC
jgi:transposase